MLRSVCGPLLGLEPQVSGADYLSRRGALGASEVSRILLEAAGIDTYVVDTGFRSGDITSPAQLAGITGARSAEIVRLEAVAEALAEAGTGADGFMGAFATDLASQLQQAVGVKSIIAYRYGLDFDPDDGLPPGHHGHGPGHHPAAQLPVPPRSGLPRAGLPARVRSGRGWSAGVSPGYSASGWRPGRSPLATPAGTWR